MVRVSVSMWGCRDGEGGGVGERRWSMGDGDVPSSGLGTLYLDLWKGGYSWRLLSLSDA